MSDETLQSPESSLDEQRIARAVGFGLPLLTLMAAVILGVTQGLATAILALAAGLLLGVIALLWSSVRLLSSDAALSPELEALDMAAQGVDALAGRRKMLLRALKDLENEHAIGKIEDEDFQQISSTYRSELKTVLKRIDDSLAPHRAKAEEAARAHLAKVGLEPSPSSSTEAAADNDEAAATDEKPSVRATTDARVTCPSCGESNEPDAKFCKECATKLAPKATHDV